MAKTVLWLSFIWIPALICWVQLNEAKFKKNITVGVTLPPQAQSDEGVLKILADYRRNTIASTGFVIVLGVLCWMIDTPYMMTVSMIWVLVGILFPMLPFIYANLKLKDYKKEKGWVQQPRTVYVDTGAIENTRTLSPWLFVPPVVICLIPAFLDRSLIMVYVLFAAFCASFWFGYRYLYRNKAEMFNDDSGVTNALSRMRRYNWGKEWLMLSYGMALCSIAMSVPARYQTVAMIVMMAGMTAMIFYVVHLEMKARRIQQKLTENSGSGFYVDEDDHWPLGMFYYNPDDTHFIINNRTGLNTTINVARPAGKILMGLTALLLAALPFMGLYFDRLGTKPIELAVNEEALTVRSGHYHYEVQLDEIAHTELLEKLPSNLSRKMGTGTQTLSEGTWAAEEYGTMKLLIDPNVSPFILIETKDGKYWLFNCRESAETQAVFNELNQ